MTAILDAIQESPKRYDDLTSLMGRTQLDIHLDKLRKQGKIKLNEHGKWEIPKPPCMVDEPLRVLTTDHKQKISITKKRSLRGPSDDTHRTCDKCGKWKANPCFPKNGSGYREFRCYSCVAKRHRELRAMKGNQI